MTFSQINNAPEAIRDKFKKINSFDVEFMKYQKNILEKSLNDPKYVDLFFIKSFYDVFDYKIKTIKKIKSI